MQERIPKTIAQVLGINLGVAAVIFLVSISVPIFGFFSALFLPLPVMILRVHMDRRTAGMVTAALVVGMAVILEGPSPDLLFFFELTLAGFILADAFDTGASLEAAFLRSLGAVLGTGVALILLYTTVSTTTLSQMAEAYVATNLQLMSAIYRDMGMSETEMARLADMTRQVSVFLVRTLPAMAGAFTLMILWLNLLMFRRWAFRSGYPLGVQADLKTWKTPDALIWWLIGCGIAVMLPVAALDIIGKNGIIFLITIYFFQGMAIVSFYFEKKQIPALLRVILYTFIFLQQVLIILIIGLGLFDMWADFRRLSRPPTDADAPPREG